MSEYFYRSKLSTQAAWLALDTLVQRGRNVGKSVALLCGVGEGSVGGPLFFIATLCDVTIVADDVIELLHVRYGLSVMVHLIAYANDI